MAPDTMAFDQALIRDAGFVFVGEPLAVDLVNTRKRRADPPRDMLHETGGDRAFWVLQSGRLPAPAVHPPLDETDRLRDAITRLTDAVLHGGAFDADALDHVNRVAGRVARSTRLVAAGDAASDTAPRLVAASAWDTSDGAAANLAAVAASAVDLLASPDVARLRRCAAHSCSMLFVATNAKRKWCTAEGCGNRERVARFSAARPGAV